MPTPAQLGAAHEVLEPVFAATLAVTINAQETILKPGTLTAAMTINATNGASLQLGATLKIVLVSDATIRIVTFGTGFGPSGTLTTVASKEAVRLFHFSGTQWIDGIEA